MNSFTHFFLTAVECPSLNTTDHAVKTGFGCSGPTSRFGTVCFFSCILGYEVARGSLHRTCQENREWSGAQLSAEVLGKLLAKTFILYIFYQLKSFRRCRKFRFSFYLLIGTCPLLTLCTFYEYLKNLFKGLQTVVAIISLMCSSEKNTVPKSFQSPLSRFFHYVSFSGPSFS